jgi:hypothetical protein
MENEVQFLTLAIRQLAGITTGETLEITRMGFDTETTDQSSSGDYDKSIPSANNHPARFIGLVDLGHHDNTYNNQTSVLRTIMYLWEIMDEERPNGDPFVMDQEYTWMPKMGKKSGLRKMLEGWQGQAFPEGYKPNLAKVVGQPCLLNIGHAASRSGNQFARILGISRPMAGQQIPDPTLPPIVWDLVDHGLDLSGWPDWRKGRYMPIYQCSIEDYIRSSYEGLGKPIPVKGKQAVPAGASADGDTPF